MNQDPSQVFPIRWQTLRPWLTTLAVIWFLGFIGLGWLIKSFLVLIGFITLAPIVAFMGLRWWLSRSLIQDTCPVCQFEFTALKQAQARCPNCGEQLSVNNGKFQRLSSPGTIDIQAVEVTAQVLDDENPFEKLPKG
ncbi:MAG: hypothetical protein WCD18_01045 [Thermosynechococcaceae cyanobacterium]